MDPIDSSSSYGDVAQLVERLLCKQEVVGSIPIVSTDFVRLVGSMSLPLNDTPRISAALVGAQRSGTTTLASLLGQHPSIFLARNKEAHFFDQERVQRNGLTQSDFDSFFGARQLGQVLLDATPAYLYLPGSLEALLRHSPDVRIIVILRNPADRAFSHYSHECRQGYETKPYLIALALERRRLRREKDPLSAQSAHRHFSYVDRGRYGRQLKHLYSLTNRHHVVLFSDLLAHPQRVVDGICDFLEVARFEIEHLPHLNEGGARLKRMERLVTEVVQRRSTRETEDLLSLPRGFLRKLS